MDETYALYRRLILHWRRSRQENRAEQPGGNAALDDECHARRLFAQCGRSLDLAGMTLDHEQARPPR